MGRTSGASHGPPVWPCSLAAVRLRTWLGLGSACGLGSHSGSGSGALGVAGCAWRGAWREGIPMLWLGCMLALLRDHLLIPTWPAMRVTAPMARAAIVRRR